ncbi:hypothetical protein niasHT_039663 [Heterodera trifolii]|uniref:Uncharacterized protein n=1 Tax=Heterodera trifolii TaxID=157864 RepID=A0ABD2IL10_9BILA
MGELIDVKSLPPLLQKARTSTAWKVVVAAASTDTNCSLFLDEFVKLLDRLPEDDRHAGVVGNVAAGPGQAAGSDPDSRLLLVLATKNLLEMDGSKKTVSGGGTLGSDLPPEFISGFMRLVGFYQQIIVSKSAEVWRCVSEIFHDDCKKFFAEMRAVLRLANELQFSFKRAFCKLSDEVLPAKMHGHVAFTQYAGGSLCVKGTLFGLSRQNVYLIHVYIYGDTSNGSVSVGTPFAADEQNSLLIEIDTSATIGNEDIFEFSCDHFSLFGVNSIIGRALVLRKTGEGSVPCKTGEVAGPSVKRIKLSVSDESEKVAWGIIGIAEITPADLDVAG